MVSIDAFFGNSSRNWCYFPDAGRFALSTRITACDSSGPNHDGELGGTAMDSSLHTPVLLLIFNRPSTTKVVFDAVRDAKPRKLYVAGDGPRSNVPGDLEKVERAQQIATSVDWDCQVETLFRNENLGCKQGIGSAISWFFEHEPEGIILEDDCVPSHSFFRFCEVVLDRYRDDKRIMIISGTNVAGEWKAGRQSYHFSYYGGISGWATWRRAWRHYDPNMVLYRDPEVAARMKDVLCSTGQYKWRRCFLDMALQGELDTWAYPWAFARIINSGLAVVPSRNLISNIGFGASSTHTRSQRHPLAELEKHELDFPLRNPLSITVDRDYDRRFFAMHTRNCLLRMIMRVPVLYRLVRRVYYRILGAKT